MSDWYAGRIHIGGTLPAKKLPELARIILDTNSNIQMNWSLLGEDRHVTARNLRDWLVEREKPGSLFLHAEELMDGSFQTLEQWLCVNEMSFLRHSDSYCDVEAEIVGFIGGARVRYDANNTGDVMVRACDVWRAKEMLAQGRVLDAMALLNALLPSAFEADVPPFMVKYSRGRLR